MIVRITRRASNASIASYVHTMISMCNAAKFLGCKAYVDWGRCGDSGVPTLYDDSSRGSENMWEWFLVQPMVGGETCTAHDVLRGIPLWVYEDAAWRPAPRIGNVWPDQRWELPWNAQDAAAVDALRQIVPQFLKFKANVTERGDALFAKYNLDPARTIAISHRGTDKHREAEIAPIERYYPHINAREGMQIWVKAEEKAVAARVRQMYPHAVVMDDFFQADGGAVMADLLNQRSGYEKALDALTTLYMLSRCRVLMKNAGNLADLAAGLSTGEVVCVQ